MSNKQKLNNQKQEFLLTFFDNKSEYQEKEINGFWLIKSWNGNYKRWQVSLFSQESYKNYKSYKEQRLL